MSIIITASAQSIYIIVTDVFYVLKISLSMQLYDNILYVCDHGTNKPNA